MTEARFSIAAARHEAVVLVVPGGDGTETKQGTAAWKPADGPGAVSRHAAVKTSDGELHSGNWPSCRAIFTAAGLKVCRAVVDRDRAKTIAALNELKGITDEVLVDALFDEAESCKFTGSLVDTLNGLAEQRPGIAKLPRVVAAQRTDDSQNAANKAADIRRQRELRERLDAMTQVAVGQSTAKEADAIKNRILKHVSIRPDGTARTVRTTRFGSLPVLRNGYSLEGLEKLAVAIGNDRHMIAETLVYVNWQESPDESDVSGSIETMRGRQLTTEEAGKRNTRIIRKSLAVAEAKADLTELLSIKIPEHDGLPVGAEEVVAARAVSTGGYGTSYYMTLDGSLIQRNTAYDWPVTLRSTRPNASRRSIAKGLKIKISELPKPERHTDKAP